MVSKNINDLSARAALIETIAENTHIPVVFLLTPKQRDYPQYMSPSKISDFLGSDVLKRGSKFYSHQSQLLEVLAANNNPFLFYPVAVDGAQKSLVRLSLVVTDLCPEHGDDAIPRVLGQPATRRYALAWRAGVTEYPEDNRAYGQAQAYQEDTNVMVYPIIEAQIDYRGSIGDKYGFRIEQLTSDDLLAGISNEAIMPFKLTLLDKTTSNTPQIVKSIYGDDSVNFTLGANDTNRNGEFTLLDVVYAKKFLSEQNNEIENFGEFSEFKVYTENVETLQLKLYKEESQYDDQIPAKLQSKWSLAGKVENSRGINIITGKLFDGKTNYQTFTVDKAMLMGTSNSVFAEGGSDGFETPRTSRDRFNQANSLVDLFVYGLKSTVESGISNLHNRDRWDYMFVYDTGFAPQAKETLISILGERKDVILVLTPHYYGKIEEVVDIPVYVHRAYMQTVNGNAVVPFTRTGLITITGFISSMDEYRQITDFAILVDGRQVETFDFTIDATGHWSAKINASELAKIGTV
jgi:hypothetical protein